MELEQAIERIIRGEGVPVEEKKDYNPRHRRASKLAIALRRITNNKEKN